MPINITTKLINPWEILAAHQQTFSQGQYGASTIFIGTMRDFNDDQSIQKMTLEHYPGMTEKHLDRICQQAIEQWQLVDALIHHRVGDIYPDETIVLIAAWSAHRKEAFEASRFMIEDLKSSAPFWKKEKTDKDERWVATNTPS